VIVVLLVAGLIIALSLRTAVGRRFWTGQLLDRDLDRYNSTPLWHGDPDGKTPWMRAAAAYRVVVRAASVGLLLLIIVGFILYRVAMVAICATAALLLVCWWARQGWRWASSYKRRRDVIRPLYMGLKRVVDWPDGTKPADVIIAPKDYHVSGVSVRLSDTFQRLDTTEEHTVDIAARTLGGEWEPTWHLEGRPTIDLRHAPPPPDIADWDRIKYHLAEAAEHMLFLGFGSRDVPIFIDIDALNPHILLSCGTGAGKSSVARSFMAQQLHHGNRVINLDMVLGHNWADDVPGVAQAYAVGNVARQLLAIDEEILRRFRALAANPELRLQRIFVVFEELNITTNHLAADWSARRGTTGTAPSILALHRILQSGRRARVTGLIVAQRGSAYAFQGKGGGDARENVSARILGRYFAPTWDMLVGYDTPMPPSSDHPGRMQLVTEGMPKAVQVGYLTDAQAQEWATTGSAQPEPEPELEPEPSTVGGFA
jgi:hypothetical protein